MRWRPMQRIRATPWAGRWYTGIPPAVRAVSRGLLGAITVVGSHVIGWPYKLVRLLFSSTGLSRALCLAAALCIAACSLVPDQGSLRGGRGGAGAAAGGQYSARNGSARGPRSGSINASSTSTRLPKRPTWALANVAFKDRRPHDAVRWYLAAQANAQTPEQRNDALLWHGRAALDAGELSAARRSFEHLAAAPEASTISVAWALNGIGLTLLLQGRPARRGGGNARRRTQGTRRADVRGQLKASPRNACGTGRTGR